jgi:nitrogen fixation protein NifB
VSTAPAPAAVFGLKTSRLRLPAAPAPLVFRRDVAIEPRPALDAGDVLRLSAAARRAVRGALVVEIEGPGDPLASGVVTLRALALLRDHEPSVLAGLVVDGPLLAEYADELSELGLHHLVLRVDATSASIARRVYGNVLHRGELLSGSEAARFVLEEQRRALRVARWHRLPVAVRFTAIPAVNLDEIGSVAALAAAEGAARVDVVPHVPRPGAPLARFGVATRGEVEDCRRAVRRAFGDGVVEEGRLARLEPSRLREIPLEAVESADACFPLEEPEDAEPAAILPPRRSQVVAVASTDGDQVDRSLADAGALRIYAVGAERIRCLGTRAMPSGFLRRRDGVGSAPALLAAVAGCRGVVATRFSPRATTLLQAVGIRPYPLVGPVEEILDRLARGTLRA